MLRKIRILLALFFWVLLTWLLVDVTGVVHTYLGWMAKVQFVPALLSVNVAVLLFLVVLTLVMGRIYCSVICPLGVMQDVVSWLRRKKNKYAYLPAKNKLRYTVLVLWAILLVANLGWVAGLIAPYSTYGRFVASAVAPLYRMANNALAGVAAHYDCYSVYGVDVWLKSGLTLGVSLVTWLIIVVLAWRGGRTWCNTICPVGTLLGLLSRRAVCGPVIDTDKCNGCGLCARNCKASCIDPQHHMVDMSRCVECGNCMEKCRQKALTFGKRQDEGKNSKGEEKSGQPVDDGRRAMLTGTALLAGTALLNAKDKTTDGGLAPIEKKKKPVRQKLITPPGSLSANHMTTHCTACQLCISACPNNVLRPSHQLDRLMQPEVSYERGYCRPECNVCSQVCPNGAIRPIEVEERMDIQVGTAKWVRDNCIPVRDGLHCDLCVRKCPAQAIQMVPLQEGVRKEGHRWIDAQGKELDAKTLLMVPVVNEEKCIGCGACENLCPSRPYSALYVEGNRVHRNV